MTTNQTTKPKTQLQVDCQRGYDYWVKNKTLRLVEVAEYAKVSADVMRYYIKANKLQRPNANVVNHRKDWIIKSYHEAVKNGKDVNWAVNLANNALGRKTIGRCDLNYYAMKNELPDLPQPDFISKGGQTKYS